MHKTGINIGVAGATGLVGQTIIDILAQHNFPVKNIRYFASSKSAGKTLFWGDIPIIVEDLAKADYRGLDIVILSIGSSLSKFYTPKLASAGAIAIDNSSCWRNDPDVPLVVSGVNSKAIEYMRKGIIANPNCTTMMIMPALKVLHELAGLKEIIVSTYQSVSGAGMNGCRELYRQVSAIYHKNSQVFDSKKIKLSVENNLFAKQIAFNLVPFTGALSDDGSLETQEEQKLRNESRKILELPELRVSATCVRVPVYVAHSLTVNARFAKKINPNIAAKALAGASENKLVDIPNPVDAAGVDEILIGRIRQDFSCLDKNGISFFVSADNLRKGAALNAVEIAELVAKKILK